ncbi:gamma-glutamyltransferase family protein [Halococcus saccharolyticus]|uniref:Gamma-glutamyltransferase n=1 Tax=Halococcus saccharolyticus DSM 5350 TaxID=1227455 RepID=M0MS41_9EURY|nr:gamma-glutamyltransferase family protein [Halococcus saccharolyticus]EMA47554.1 gamma-glutamyltransferase [Halococcus saccharolyticus DSM 5350]
MPEPDLDRFTSRRSTVYADRGIVATSQPLAAEAGVEILRNGGNAFDAAVATAAALNVVEPTSTGLGGDAFALYRTADGETGAMRACGGAPAEATIENVRTSVREHDDADDWYPSERGYAVDGSDTAAEIEMPFLGPHAVTVPGTARGWEATVERHGRRSLGEVLQPAIRYATEGYPVSEIIAHHWQAAEELFTDANAADAYLKNGSAPSVGERMRLPRLGESLRMIAEQGADVVYNGEIGEEIANEVQSKGGFLTVDDLAAFEPEFPDPVSTRYNGAEVYELPPNNQGLIALEALNIAAEIDAGEYPLDSPERVHYFAEATKRAFHDGHRYITDPAYEDVPPLTSSEWARRRAADVDATASDVSFGVPDARAEDADTVLLCVADDAGNVVSFINSRFAGFGSGLVAGDTGIALQNRGASFSLDPDHPNSLEPGKRPFHTLIPGIIDLAPDSPEDDWAAFGVMGGYMQPQGHVQVVSNLVDYDLPLQAALDRPRWRYREDGSLAVEGRIDGTLATKLARMGHDVRVLAPSLFGGAQIARNRDGVLSGATEPRKDGSVAGF